MALPFLHPSTIYIPGPSGSGKTEFVCRVLRSRMIRPFPKRIIWVYSTMQPSYERLKRQIPNIEFIDNFDETLLSRLNRNERNLVILDDQMEKASDRSALSKLFTEGSHHWNLTVIFIVQNMFHKGTAMRDVSLNSQYMVTFRSVRDKGQIRSLARQISPNHPKAVVDAYAEATSKPYGYLVLDFRTETEEVLRLRTRIFPEESVRIFAPANTPSPMTVMVPKV